MGRVLQSPAPRRAPSKTLHPPVLQKKTMFPELFYVGQASNSALPCQACLCLQHEQCGIWWSRTELCGRYDLTGNALPPSSLLIPLWLQAGKRGQARQTQPLQGAVLQRKAHPPRKVSLLLAPLNYKIIRLLKIQSYERQYWQGRPQEI